MTTNVMTTDKMKEKALEHIVSAIIELEEHTPRCYSCSLMDNKFIVSRSLTSYSFKMTVTSQHVEIWWLGRCLLLKRATCEEEYFQMMCVDEMYCDVEFEEGIKLLVELHINRILNNSAIAAYKEGVYDNQSDRE